MQDMVIMLAKIMPEEDLINQLADAIAEYKLVPTDKNKSAVTMYSFMVSVKLMTPNKSTLDVLEDAEKAKKVHDLLNTTES